MLHFITSHHENHRLINLAQFDFVKTKISLRIIDASMHNHAPIIKLKGFKKLRRKKQLR